MIMNTRGLLGCPLSQGTSDIHTSFSAFVVASPPPAPPPSPSLVFSTRVIPTGKQTTLQSKSQLMLPTPGESPSGAGSLFLSVVTSLWSAHFKSSQLKQEACKKTWAKFSVFPPPAQYYTEGLCLCCLLLSPQSRAGVFPWSTSLKGTGRCHHLPSTHPRAPIPAFTLQWS